MEEINLPDKKETTMAKMSNQIADYYCEDQGSWYTMEDDTLLTRMTLDEEWGEVNVEHCANEGLNLQKVYSHFGMEKVYIEILLDELKRWRQA